MHNGPEQIAILADKLETTRNNGGDIAVIELLKLNPNKEDVDKSLLWASKNGHLLLVQAILELGPNLNPTDISQYKDIPLIEALLNNHYEIAKILLQAGANPNCVEQNEDYSPLIFAILSRSSNLVETFIRYGADVNFIDDDYETPLMKAATESTAEIVQLLIDNGANVNFVETDGMGWTALMFAAGNNSSDVVRTLLLNKASVSIVDNSNNTALFFVNNADSLSLLIEAGADVHHENDSGQTPLIHAAIGGYSDVIEMLINHNANVNCKDLNGKTPLMYAAKMGKVAAITSLISNGANVHEIDENGETALMYAATSGSFEAISKLIDNGAKVNGFDFKRRTALMHAVMISRDNENRDYRKYNFIETVNILMQNGACVNRIDEERFTPLSHAVSANIIEIVETLIQHGANVNHIGGNGLTPLIIAGLGPRFKDSVERERFLNGCVCTYGNDNSDQIVKVLLQHGADPSFVNQSGKSALHSNWYKRSMRYLLAYESILRQLSTLESCQLKEILKNINHPVPAGKNELFALQEVGYYLMMLRLSHEALNENTDIHKRKALIKSIIENTAALQTSGYYDLICWLARAWKQSIQSSLQIEGSLMIDLPELYTLLSAVQPRNPFFVEANDMMLHILLNQVEGDTSNIENEHILKEAFIRGSYCSNRPEIKRLLSRILQTLAGYTPTCIPKYMFESPPSLILSLAEEIKHLNQELKKAQDSFALMSQPTNKQEETENQFNGLFNLAAIHTTAPLTCNGLKRPRTNDAALGGRDDLTKKVRLNEIKDSQHPRALKLTSSSSDSDVNSDDKPARKTLS